MHQELSQLTDEQLIAKYRQSGLKLAVGELFKRHSLMCFAVCNKYLKDEQAAEDAAMSVFEKLFKDLKNHEIQNFKSWLHSVCRNYCLMQLRKPLNTLRIHDADEENESNFVNLERFLHQEENTEEKERTYQTLERAISELKDKQKECIELFYLKQKSYDEIAELTGYTNNEVKSYIQNGKRNLKIALSGKDLSVLFLILWIQNIA
jgi:RNA polymerase sigma factor (sigma-70 family)